jgi:FAD linked oxidases, C-terminal domain
MHPEDIELMPEGQGWLVVEFGGETKEEADGQGARPDSRAEEELGPAGGRSTSTTARSTGTTARAACMRAGTSTSRVCPGLRSYRSFLDEASDLVLELGGSLSGEHGDGQSRAELLPKMFGPELIDAFREFKSIWDPDWKMNPGKVVDAYRITENLRLGPDYARPSSSHITTRVDCVLGTRTRSDWSTRLRGWGRRRRVWRTSSLPSGSASPASIPTGICLSSRR